MLTQGSEGGRGVREGWGEEGEGKGEGEEEEGERRKAYTVIDALQQLDGSFTQHIYIDDRTALLA